MAMEIMHDRIIFSQLLSCEPRTLSETFTAGRRAGPPMYSSPFSSYNPYNAFTDELVDDIVDVQKAEDRHIYILKTCLRSLSSHQVANG